MKMVKATFLGTEITLPYERALQILRLQICIEKDVQKLSVLNKKYDKLFLSYFEINTDGTYKSVNDFRACVP